MSLKKGDKVVVIAGKDKGKEGTIINVLKDDRVIVEGINIVKKHIKPNGQDSGRIEEMENSIHVSNVMIIDPKSKKRTRIGHSIDKNGKKVRIAKKSNQKID